MESKEVQTAEDLNFSLNIKPQTKNEGVQTSEKKNEPKSSQNNSCISFKDLFINTEKDKEKEEAKTASKAT